MSKTVTYYASLASPWTYLGHKRLIEIADKTGARINFKPVEFGMVFSATGGLPLPKRSPERQKYRFMELKRWRHELDLPLNLEPKFFPADPALASYMCIAAAENGSDALSLGGQFLQAVWQDEQNIADPDTICQIADNVGLDGKALLAQANDPKYAAQFKSDSEDAINQGVFGAPSYVIDDEIFWGQDRLYFVEKALEA